MNRPLAVILGAAAVAALGHRLAKTVPQTPKSDEGRTASGDRPGPVTREPPQRELGVPDAEGETGRRSDDR